LAGYRCQGPYSPNPQNWKIQDANSAENKHRNENLGEIGYRETRRSPQPNFNAILTQAKPLNSIYGSRGRIFQAKAATGIGPSQAVAVASVDGGMR
jgi:hypothetical protein